MRLFRRSAVLPAPALCAAGLLLHTISGFAQGPAVVTSITYPGATMTVPRALNNLHQVTGSFNPGDGTMRGFLRQPDGSLAEFVCPDGRDTHAHGINDAGLIVGDCGVPTTSYGFLRGSDGSFTRIDFPGAFYTQALAINAAGVIVGTYSYTQSVGHGFIRDAQGVMTSLEVPGAIGTVPVAINTAGQIAGRYWDGASWRPFLRAPDGALTTFEAPWQVVSLDDAGRVFGQTDSPGVHWKRELDGAILPIATPANEKTLLSAVNNLGTMIGSLWSSASGYLAVPCGEASISSSARSHGPGNESGAITVTAPPGCAWTAASHQDWLTHQGATFSESGSFSYVVLPNSSGAERVGAINIAGQLFTVTQQPGACDYTLSGTQAVSPYGGSGLIHIVTSPECGWVAQAATPQPYGIREPVSWLSIFPPASGFGSATVPFEAAGCPGCSASVLIGDRSLLIQAASLFSQIFIQDDLSRAVTTGYLRGNSVATTAELTGPVPGWRLAAAADFDRNGVLDLIWQNETTGEATLWLIGGPVGSDVIGWTYLPYAGPPWRLVAAHDFDRDGTPDLVWQNQENRSATLWYMQWTGGTASLQKWTLLAGPQPGWRIAGVWSRVVVGKMSDSTVIVWQHDTTGDLTAWIMFSMFGTDFPYSQLTYWIHLASGFGPEWRVVGTPSAPGRAPTLVWQNEVTRKITLWHMPWLSLESWEFLDPAETPGARILAP
jgi:uncharacterized membrane protein